MDTITKLNNKVKIYDTVSAENHEKPEEQEFEDNYSEVQDYSNNH